MRVLDAVLTRARNWRERIDASDRVPTTGGPYIDPATNGWYVLEPGSHDDGDESEDPDEPTLADDVHTAGRRRF